MRLVSGVSITIDRVHMEEELTQGKVPGRGGGGEGEHRRRSVGDAVLGGSVRAGEHVFFPITHGTAPGQKER